MSRNIKEIMRAWGNVRRSIRTGLEYPYKSSIVIEEGCMRIDTRPLLSESEADLVDKAILRLSKIDPVSHSILKSVYEYRQSNRTIAKNIHKSNDYVGDQLKIAEIYVLAKIDDVMSDVIL